MWSNGSVFIIFAGLGSLNKILNNLHRIDLLEFGDGKTIKKMQVGKWDVSKSSIDFHSVVPKLWYKSW